MGFFLLLFLYLQGFCSFWVWVLCGLLASLFGLFFYFIFVYIFIYFYTNHIAFILAACNMYVSIFSNVFVLAFLSGR